jgi:hypothetical protein
MKIRLLFSLAALCALPLQAGAQAPAPAPAPAPGEELKKELTAEVEKGCEAEIKSHCRDVTPGEGRIVACLYAHEDKLSGRCEYALYDATAQLQRAISAMSFVASECDADLNKHCASVQAGEGRLLQCLKDHRTELTDRCEAAFEDVEDQFAD